MIYKGVEDNTIGIPFVALVLNLSWTCLFSFFVEREKVYSIDQISFFLYLFILVQALYYGGSTSGHAAGDLQQDSYRRQKQMVYCCQLAVWTVVTLGLIRGFIDGVGRGWSHNSLFYIIQMITSILFPQMLLSRGNTSGQHISVPILRCVGMVFGWMYQANAISVWCTLGSLFATLFYSYSFYLCYELPADFYAWRGLFLETASSPAQYQSAPAGGNPMPMANSNEPGNEYHAPRMNVPLMNVPEA